MDVAEELLKTTQMQASGQGYDLAIAILSVVMVALVAMYFIHRRDMKRNNVQIRQLYEGFIEAQKEDIQKITEIAQQSKQAIENNNRILDNNNDILREFIRKL